MQIILLAGYDDENPQHSSHRMILLTVIVFSYLVKVYYESSLVAVLSSKREVFPFTGLDGLYSHRASYTLGLVKGSSAVEQFKVDTFLLL